MTDMDLPAASSSRAARVLSSNEHGRWGEATAAAYFERAGWRVLDRNFRFGRNEIDLIVTRADTVAFVEVKARSRGLNGFESITREKRAGIRRAAAGWLCRYGRSNMTYRFDAISVSGVSGSAFVEHLPEAWGI